MKIPYTGTFHKANGPINYWNDHNWQWALYGKYHRYYGPAHDDGRWAIHGKQWYPKK